MGFLLFCLQRFNELEHYHLSSHEADIEVLVQNGLPGVPAASVRMEKWSVDKFRAHLQWRAPMCDPQGNGLEYSTGSLGELLAWHQQETAPVCSETGPCLPVPTCV